MAPDLTLAQRFAWSLARTLMTPVVLFRSDAGYAVLPSSEYDGDADAVIHEYDPFPS